MQKQWSCGCFISATLFTQMSAYSLDHIWPIEDSLLLEVVRVNENKPG